MALDSSLTIVSLKVGDTGLVELASRNPILETVP